MSRAVPRGGPGRHRSLPVLAAAVAALAAAVAWWVAPGARRPVPPAGGPEPSVRRAGPGPGAAGAEAAREPEAAPTPAGGGATAASPAPAATAGAGLEIPLADETVAVIDGVALRAEEVFPAGTLGPGSRIPRETYRTLLEEAVKRRVVVREAERRGYADDPEFLRLMGELREDVSGQPGLTPAERDWQLRELRETALAGRLYREEGIGTRRVTPAEIDARYRERSAEYDWLRKREAARGSTPARIEYRVREQIRADLEAPLHEEALRLREELAARLRLSIPTEVVR